MSKIRKSKFVMALALIGMLFMASSSMAATTDVTNLFLPMGGGAYTKFGSASTQYGNRWTRVNIIQSSLTISSSCPIKVVQKKTAKNTSADISKSVGTVTSTNTPVKLTLKDNVSISTYYIHGRLTSAAKVGSSICAYWEF